MNLLTIAAKEQRAHLASAGNRTLKGLDPDIDPDRAPKNFKDAMSRKDRQEWAEALNKEYIGFTDRTALAVVKPPKGERILGTLTRWEYKEDNGRLVKYTIRMVVRGDQQVEGESFTSSYLYATTKPKFSRGNVTLFQGWKRLCSAPYNALQWHSECAELKRDGDCYVPAHMLS